jgi:diguanylate cyclase (GGDEF)-like protein
VAFAAAVNSVLVAAAHTPVGAVADALAYLWLAAYVAIFFPAAAVPTATLMAASYGAGLLAGGLPGLQSAWAVITVSLIALAAALARASRMMRRSIATDELTGALNRRGLQAVAGTLRARRRRCRERHAVAVLDLDGFKAINDGRGHHVGDQLLAEASAAWRGALRGADVLARTGGDEFVVVMPGTSADEAERVLERLRVAYPVAWSAGVTSWAPAEEPLTSCLQRADRRLYEAKAGR